ncbi:PAS domain-containing protein [Halorubrum sp. SY-15]|uniref:PAS domain-containing protein n=1 Tax=Halorubrum sp. SY-15 TaxID=3402277 RepID=UPI003EBCD379
MRDPGRVPGVLAALAGVLTLGVGFDVVQDWYVLEIAPWIAVVENAVPFALTGTLYYAAWWAATTDLDPAQQRAIVRWTLAGAATMVAFSGWIVGVQLVQGGLQPLVLVVQLAAIGAVSGVVVGYRTAEVTGTRDSLTQQRSWFDAVFENTYQLTGLVQPDGTVTAINETAAASIDEPESAVVGEPLWETPWFAEREDARATARRGVERARSGEPFRDQVRVRGTAQTRLLEVAVRPVTDGDGDVDILIVEGRDVTALEQRERQLRVTNRFLRHNIRNRLTLIYGNAERIARGEVTGADATAAAEAITDAATELEVTAGTARTVNGLVQNAPDPVEVDLAETLEQTAETVETTRPDASVVVDAPATTRVKSLPEPEAAIERLVTVALTACAPSPSPTVQIDVSTDGTVTVRLVDGALSDPEQAVLCGDLEVGPLHHADGLDVWYVYWYVELSGGTIAVENDGRTIRVQLPLAGSNDRTPGESAVTPR